MIKKRLIIAGPRDFQDREFVYKIVEETVSNICKENSISSSEIEIVEGGARGVDSYAKEYALNNDIHYSEFKADWTAYGKSAGPIRNQQMARYGDILLAFANGSRGTASMIREALNASLEIHIVNIRKSA